MQLSLLQDNCHKMNSMPRVRRWSSSDFRKLLWAWAAKKRTLRPKASDSCSLDQIDSPIRNGNHGSKVRADSPSVSTMFGVNMALDSVISMIYVCISRKLSGLPASGSALPRAELSRVEPSLNTSWLAVAHLKSVRNTIYSAHKWK